MSSSTESGSGSSSDSSSSDSASSSDGIVFPDDFPLDLRVYDQTQFDHHRPILPPQANPNDPRRRDFDSLYPLDWLIADSTANGATPSYPSASIGRLRTQWQQAFQQNANGDWKHVEYVPAWSDPDWSTRYAYTRGVTDADMDEVARQYIKPGMLQTQRPAIRPNDASLRPTQAAKRWGIYPWHTWDDVDGHASPKGWSGVTPCVPGFPVVQLDQPRFSPDVGGFVDAITVDDLATERQRLEEWRRHNGLETTDEDFEQILRSISLEPTAGPIRKEKAASLLVILEFLQKEQGKKEYQRLLFGGNTTNELVEQGAWTLGADASTDLANPLHDLVLRSKWTRTETKGLSEDKPRVVYNLSGKQGEYTAHNEIFWVALQPALQLVSQVLNSQHPATWVWTDVRKLRPVEDSRGATGSSRVWKFCTSPDHDVDVAELTGLARNWDDFVDICASGFDSSGYACRILNRTIEWDINSNWRIFSEGNGANLDGSSRCYGSTIVQRVHDPSSQTPFKIKISIAAELLWPLLIDEYSPAEKAATSLYTAVTMLHELSHALILARSQLFMPGSCKQGDEPLWLLLEPSWRQEITNFNTQHSVDILDALQTFGARMQHEESAYEDQGVFWPVDEVYWQAEPNAEEGWATENQYFGGLFEAIPAGSAGSFPNFDHFRFLEEATYIAAMRGWETDPGFEGRFQVLGALAMSESQKMYSKSWWNSEFVTFGPAAMKMFNTKSTIRGILNLTILHVKTLWDLAGKRYGNDVRDWLRRVWRRVKQETDNQFLWRYLFYKTIVATEAEACEQIWFVMQSYWDLADVAVWNDRSAVFACATELEAALDNISDRNTDSVYDWSAQLPVAEFRRLSAALWHVQSALSREATFFQNVAVSFVTLDDRVAKDELFRLYSERITVRITYLYVRVCNDVRQIVDALDNMGTSCPNLTSWLFSSPDIARIWNRNAVELRERMGIISQHLVVVSGIFSADPTKRTVTIDQLGAIPSGAAHSLADRIKRIAMREYHALAPMDPRKQTADEWSHILSHGDLLREPLPHSDAAQFNQQLHGRVENIDAGVATHQRTVVDAYPDPQVPRHIVDSHALIHQQSPAAAEAWDRIRIPTSDEEAARDFTSATGFQPYSDSITGFTRFADVRANQPNIRQPLQPTPAYHQQQGQHDPGVYLNSLDRSIEQIAAQVQQMSHPRGQPVDLATPAPTIFGAATAQQGQAMQQIEGFLGQRAATQEFIQRGNVAGQDTATWASYRPEQQQRFLDEQGWWRQNYGPS